MNSEKRLHRDTEIFEDDTGAGTYCCTGIGQTISGLKQYSDALGLAEYGGYALSFNGGKVISCATQEVIYTKAIEPLCEDSL